MNIIIIEDELLTANDLSSTIQKLEPEAHILAILGSVKESIEFFQANTSKPDLVFSDIQLGDGLSFEIFHRVSINTPIIFCTAYDEYALNAFKVNGIHYMLKPFSTRSVQEAFNKYRELKSTMSDYAPQYETILSLLENRKKPRSILVYQNDKILPIPINAIALFFIEHEITYLVTFDQNRYSMNKTMEELEALAGQNFYRANRQFLVNRRAIKDSSQYFARKLVVNLSIPFEHQITISKTKVTDYLNWLST